MKTIFIYLKKNLITNILIATFVGLVYGQFFNTSPLKSLIPVVLLMMVFPMFLKVKISDLLEIVNNPKPVLTSLIVNATLIPFYAYLLGKLFFNTNPELMMGLLIMALIPTGGMTPTWTGFSDGDIKSSVLMMTVNLLFAIFLIPLYLNMFLGTVIQIDNGLIFLSLVKTVIVPLILANIVRTYIVRKKGEHFLNEQKITLSGISSLGIISLVFIAMSIKSNTILGNISLSLSLFIPLALFYLGNTLVSHLISVKLFGRKEGVAFVYSILLRNLTIALAITVSISTESMAVLLIALANIVQQPMAALYMKVANRKKMHSKVATQNK